MFRELFNVAPDAMIVVDTSGRIVRANPQAEALFGFDASAMTGQPIEMLMPESARHSHASHRAGYVANPRVRLMGTGQELTGLKRSGETFPVEIALSPLNSPQGQLFLAAVRDVSETQLARKALVRSRFDAVLAQVGQLALSEASLDAAMQKALEPIVDRVGGASRGDRLQARAIATDAGAGRAGNQSGTDQRPVLVADIGQSRRTRRAGHRSITGRRLR